jgi:hypothetical protein
LIPRSTMSVRTIRGTESVVSQSKVSRQRQQPPHTISSTKPRFSDGCLDTIQDGSSTTLSRDSLSGMMIQRILFERVADIYHSLMLIPQSLSYAKIATIPVEYGLMSSWLPPTIYAIMGSTKGIGRQQLYTRVDANLAIRSFHWSNITTRSDHC